MKEGTDAGTEEDDEDENAVAVGAHVLGNPLVKDTH